MKGNNMMKKQPKKWHRALDTIGRGVTVATRVFIWVCLGIVAISVASIALVRRRK
jgi:hypothetical protein